MIYKQFANENTGLSYLQQPKEVTTGLSGLDFAGMFDNAGFKGVYMALYTYLWNNLPPMKKVTITAQPSYVPDMLRLYMTKVSLDRKAYSPSDLEGYWVPYFTNNGFDPEITKLFFKHFFKLNSDGLVPRSIWFPNPESIMPAADNTGGVIDVGMSTGTMFGIGAAVIVGLGGLYFLMKK